MPQLEATDTHVELDAAPGLEIPAQLTEAAGTADPRTQTYWVRLGTLLIFMGWRSVLVIGTVLMLTIAATLMTMSLIDVPMHRISQGALIIALGKLADNAIVVTEGILVGTQRGRRKLDIAKKVVAKIKWPLLGGTLVGLIAFAPIGFATGDTAEYTNDPFRVIMVSLFFSWIFALTLTPLMCYWLFAEAKEADATRVQEGGFSKAFKTFVRVSVNFRWGVIALALAVFGVMIWGTQFIKDDFFPTSTTPQIVVDYWLPEGSDISATDRDMVEIEDYVMGLDSVDAVQTMIGAGTLRYMLIYQFQSQNSSYGQLLIRMNDFEQIDDLIPAIQKEPYRRELPGCADQGLAVCARSRFWCEV